MAIVAGAAILAAGSWALVRGSVGLATAFGVSETLLGLTVVAMGTSTPELVTSLVAAWRGNDDIAVANVVGSNIFNVLGIGGVTALVHPVTVPPTIIASDNWWMLGFSLALFPLMKSGMQISRAEGAVLLVGFAVYMSLLIGG